MDAFLPHDLSQARKAASIVSGSAAALLLVATGASRPASVPWPEVTTALVFALLAVYVLRTSERSARLVCFALPLLGVGGVVALNLATADASAGAQVFLVLPVLFAASQLRPRGAYVVLAAALAGQVAVCTLLLPAAVAASDIAHVSVVMTLVGVVLVHSVARQARLHDALREQAAIDPLTGLVTRRVLDDAVGASLASAEHRHGTSLLLVDVDRFKLVNDTFGHPVGDDALTLVGQVLAGASRPTDVIARMGGDELAVLLNCCPYERAMERAEDIVRLVRTAGMTTSDGRDVGLTVSIGVAHAPAHASDVRELYTAADEALYQAKRAGRDRAQGAAATVAVPAQRNGGDDVGSVPVLS